MSKVIQKVAEYIARKEEERRKKKKLRF